MCAKFPMRDKIHPWVNAEMLNPKEVPGYVRKDYWWIPDSFFAPLLNVTVPYIASVFMTPMLRSVPNIPVYRDQRIMLTFRQSIRTLQKDHYLLLFPEIPAPGKNSRSRINTGWLRLGQLWYKVSGRALKMYPVHVD